VYRHQGGTGGCRCILRLADHPGKVSDDRTAHIGWLRAAVLGANDGLISTASLMVGVAAAGTGRADILVAGVAGLVAGSMSMAAGEYVSRPRSAGGRPAHGQGRAHRACPR
jgi:VIT1/CCC1 family predicted Fe2+/Mn2+ transporter